MSKNLTLLTYDLSSFLNLDFETAYQKLSSGIAGELEPLRRVGYSLSEASLQANLNAAQTRKQLEAVNALTEGLEENSLQAILNDEAVGANVRNLTEAQKVELRYVSIIKNATKAMGDMGRTLNSPANQLRVLRVQFEMLARSIGNIFIPIINKLLPWIIAFAQVLREVADAIASFFHFELPEVDYSTLVDSSAGVADNFDDAADSAKKAKEELKDAMLPFDELHVLDEPKEAADTAAGTAGLGTGGELFEQLPDYTDILEQFADMNVDDAKKQLYDLLDVIAGVGAALGALKLGGAIFDGLGKLKAKLKEIRADSNIKITADSSPLEKLKALGSDFITGIAHGLGMITAISPQAAAAIGPFAVVIGLLVTHFANLYQNSESFRTGLERLKEIFDTLGEAAKIIGDAIYETFIKPIADFLGQIMPPQLLDFFGMLKGIFDDLDLVVGDFLTTFGSIATLIFGLVTGNPFAIIAGAVGLLGEAFSLVVRWLGNLDPQVFEDFKQSIIDKAHEIADNLPEIIKGGLRMFISQFAGGLAELVMKIIEHWDEIKAKCKEGFDALFGEDGWFTQLAQKIAKIPEWFAELPSKVSEKLEEWKAAIKTKIDEIANSIMESPLGTVFKGLFAMWDTAFEAVKTAIAIFKAVLDGDFSAIPGLISGYLDDIPDEIKGVPETIHDTFIQPVVDYFADLPERIKEACKDFGKKVDEALGGWPSKFFGLFDPADEEVKDFDRVTSEYLGKAQTTFDTYCTETSGNVTDWGVDIDKVAEDSMKNFYDTVDKNTLDSKTQMNTALNDMKKDATSNFTAINTDTKTKLDTWQSTIKTQTTAGDKQWKDKYESMKNMTDSTLKTINSTNNTSLDTLLRETKSKNASSEREWERSWGAVETTFSGSWDDIERTWRTDTNSWWNNDVTPMFRREKWSNIFGNMKSAFGDVVDDLLDSARRGFEALKRTFESDSSSGGSSSSSKKTTWASAPTGGFSIPRPTIKGYARGGIPTAGSLFMANENGTPELVGSFGGTAGVVNNDQIISAMTNAIYAAMTSAMSEQGQTPLVVELDGQVIYNNQKRIERNRGLGNFDLGAFRR